MFVMCVVQVLNLSHNHIKEIEPNAFHQVAIFSTLDLSYNHLTTIRGYGIVRLLRLDASHNFISSMDVSAFAGLHQTFQELDLSFNNLTSFFAGRLFHQTNNLLRLSLGMNNLGQDSILLLHSQHRDVVTNYFIRVIFGFQSVSRCNVNGRALNVKT
jgi:Leucine rich repeat